MTNIAFDKPASEVLNANPKVRVKVEGGVVFFRPTDRKSGAQLPSGEVLCDIHPGTDASNVDLEGAGASILAEDKNYTLAQAAGRGWWQVVESTGSPVLVTRAPKAAKETVFKFKATPLNMAAPAVVEAEEKPADLSAFKDDPEAETRVYTQAKTAWGKWRIETAVYVENSPVGRAAAGVIIAGPYGTYEEAKARANRMNLEHKPAVAA